MNAEIAKIMLKNQILNAGFLGRDLIILIISSNLVIFSLIVEALCMMIIFARNKFWELNKNSTKIELFL